jgi:peptide/nickel transport system permease protein
MFTPESPAPPATEATRRHTGRPLLIAGLVIIVVYILAAVFGPLLTADPLATDPGNALAPPSAEHWFGTDKFGRDIFARAVAAARLDLFAGVSIAGLALLVGSSVGLVAGFWGGWLDEIVMRLTDILLAFPGFILALLLVAALGDSTANVLAAVSVAYLPHFIRLTRAEALAEREKEYVQGAFLSGNSGVRAAFVHVLPNALGPALVQATLVAGWAILTVAGLAFLGVGITPPTPEWGVMVADGAGDVITGQWWTALFPGAMIVLAVMAFHFIGDELAGGEDRSP